MLLERLPRQRDRLLKVHGCLAEVGAVREQALGEMAHCTALVEDGLGAGVRRGDGLGAVEGSHRVEFEFSMPLVRGQLNLS